LELLSFKSLIKISNIVENALLTTFQVRLKIIFGFGVFGGAFTLNTTSENYLFLTLPAYEN
jgi:hypothetical protein